MRLPRRGSPADFALASLRAIGTAYLRFAEAEPGLFRTAFAVPGDVAPEPAAAGASGLNPFQLLGVALGPDGRSLHSVA